MVLDPKVSSKKIIIFGMMVGLLWFCFGNIVWAVPPAMLQDIQIHTLPEDRIQVELIFSRPVPPPRSFSVESPNSIILDFPNAANRLPKNLSTQALAMGMATGLNVVEGKDKTRVIINLRQSVPFETEVRGNHVLLTMSAVSNAAAFQGCLDNRGYHINSFDFRRGGEGEGRLIFNISSPRAGIDFKEENGKIMARFFGACIQDRLLRLYDVSDFGTPVKAFSLTRSGQDVVLMMEPSGDYEKIAYQIDNQFVIEVRHISKEERALQRKEGRYTGERISLNFQDIEVRAALQILADFAGFNLITSDSVKGNLTLRLQNVPWDQALDIILKTKGLDKRTQGNVTMIGTAAEIAAEETQELTASKQIQDLAPLRSEWIQIKYAVAEDLAGILKEKGNSLLSSRGNVTVDKRTNTLLVQDIDEKLVEVHAMLKVLDIPVRQVEISTQIVTASDSCEEAIGMRFGGAVNFTFGSRKLGVGNHVEAARAIGDFPTGNVPPSNAIIPNGLMGGPESAGPTVQTTEGLFSDLANTTSTGKIASVGLALARLPNGTLLDLELQALELESKTKTIARPKILTADQNKAVVEQGVDIPYQEATSSGATSITFKKASLRLEVTPHITPDDKISMDLVITNDSPVTKTLNSAINTNRLETKVLVDDGETVVLGGVLSILTTRSGAKVPFFGDIPIIGAIFRNRNLSDSRQELLIFITPRIVKPMAKDP